MDKAKQTELADRVQWNFRLSPDLRASVQAEIQRIGRKRDIVCQRIFEHFMALTPNERDRICTPPRVLRKAA